MRAIVIVNQTRQEMADTPEATAESLDRLDDARIDDLYHRTLREYARAAKRQTGVLV
jgi:hypothetical protein